MLAVGVLLIALGVVFLAVPLEQLQKVDQISMGSCSTHPSRG